MIKILPLGGIGHVTRNLFVYEYQQNGGQGQTERLIVDCGIGFPEEEMYGVDLLIPDISYLKGKEASIKAIVLTHGHDDHIGGLPYILPQLGKDIPIYGSRLTAGFAEDTLKDFAIDKKINVLVDNQVLKLGSFEVGNIALTHSVPDTKHIVINTPDGLIYHGSDFKIDLTPVDNKRPDLQKIASIGKAGVLCLLIDCLRVEKSGYSMSERSIGEGLERELRQTKGKLILTTMSSNIHRIQQLVDLAAFYHRKVAFVGRSVEENVRTAQRLGFINIPAKTVVNKRKINQLPDNQQCLVVGGSQGQVDSTLVRISRKEHQFVEVKPDDRVVFAADPIPGNERAVYQTVDDLAKLGAFVTYTDIQDDLHVSGHASSGELRLMLALLKPKFIMPIGGTYRHMNHFSNLAQEMGWKKDKLFLLKDGETLEVDKNIVRQGKKLSLKTVIVDGLGIGDVGKAVLAERKQMAQAGMVVVAIPVDKAKNTVAFQAEIITRGFIFVKNSQALVQEAISTVSGIVPVGMVIKDWQKIKEELIVKLGQFFFEATQRQPIILPVLVRS